MDLVTDTFAAAAAVAVEVAVVVAVAERIDPMAEKTDNWS